MCNKSWSADYNELLELSHLPSLSDHRYQSKPLITTSLQFVCNQGNHSVVKITNLFLQC